MSRSHTKAKPNGAPGPAHETGDEASRKTAVRRVPGGTPSPPDGQRPAGRTAGKQETQEERPFQPQRDDPVIVTVGDLSIDEHWFDLDEIEEKERRKRGQDRAGGLGDPGGGKPAAGLPTGPFASPRQPNWLCRRDLVEPVALHGGAWYLDNFVRMLVGPDRKAQESVFTYHRPPLRELRAGNSLTFLHSVSNYERRRADGRAEKVGDRPESAGDLDWVYRVSSGPRFFGPDLDRSDRRGIRSLVKTNGPHGSGAAGSHGPTTGGDAPQHEPVGTELRSSERADNTAQVLESIPLEIRPGEDPRVTHYPSTDHQIIVIYDAGNGFSDDPARWKRLFPERSEESEESQAERVKAVVLVTDQVENLVNNPLWEHLKNHRYLRSTVVIVFADDLRNAGVSISRGVSWERTAHDFVTRMSGAVLGELSKAAHLVVRFGISGIIHSDSQEKSQFLYYDPQLDESEYWLEKEGLMRGYNSILAATVAAALFDHIRGDKGPRHRKPPGGYEVRLIRPVDDVGDLPDKGSSLILVAPVGTNREIHVRVFDADGQKRLDTDERQLTGQAGQVEDLKRQLEHRWPPHCLTEDESNRIRDALTSILNSTATGQFGRAGTRPLDAQSIRQVIQETLSRGLANCRAYFRHGFGPRALEVCDRLEAWDRLDEIGHKDGHLHSLYPDSESYKGETKVTEMGLYSSDGPEVQLMDKVQDVHDIPGNGKNLILVARVGQRRVVHIRIFDSDGNEVVDTDESKLTGQAVQIANLKRRLAKLWPRQRLTEDESDRIRDAVRPIAESTPHPGPVGKSLDVRYSVEIRDNLAGKSMTSPGAVIREVASIIKDRVEDEGRRLRDHARGASGRKVSKPKVSKPPVEVTVKSSPEWISKITIIFHFNIDQTTGKEHAGWEDLRRCLSDDPVSKAEAGRGKGSGATGAGEKPAGWEEARNAAIDWIDHFVENVVDWVDWQFGWPVRITALDEDVKKFARVAIVENSKWSILIQRRDELQKLAQSIVRTGLDGAWDGPSGVKFPVAQFEKLLTADRDEIESYRSIRNLLREYLARPWAKEPLSIAVFGPPGSGKSFGVEEIAKSVAKGSARGIKEYKFDLSQFSSPRELANSLIQARDTALGSHVPVIFFDEFDATIDGQQLGWLKYFLSPMQSGTFRSEAGDLRVGQAVFVFAGGTCKSYLEFTRKGAAAAQQDEFRRAKGPDFVSRLRGYVDIIGPDPRPDQDDDAFVIRRALILRGLLDKYKKLREVDAQLVNALLSVSGYEHGTRSMQAILEMSALSGKTRFDKSALPPWEQLSMHLKINPSKPSEFFDLLAEKVEEGGAGSQ